MWEWANEQERLCVCVGVCKVECDCRVLTRVYCGVPQTVEFDSWSVAHGVWLITPVFCLHVLFVVVLGFGRCGSDLLSFDMFVFAQLGLARRARYLCPS